MDDEVFSQVNWIQYFNGTFFHRFRKEEIIVSLEQNLKLNKRNWPKRNRTLPDTLEIFLKKRHFHFTNTTTTTINNNIATTTNTTNIITSKNNSINNTTTNNKNSNNFSISSNNNTIKVFFLFIARSQLN